MSRPVVAIVGRPNVGKSTFLSKTTSANPKIADYHFTTRTLRVSQETESMQMYHGLIIILP